MVPALPRTNGFIDGPRLFHTGYLQSLKLRVNSLSTSFAASFGARRLGMALEDVRVEKIGFAGEIVLKSLAT
jgi:hypothetical protein